MRRVADRFREMVTGSKDGSPSWVRRLEEGSGIGLFGPTSQVWIVHSSLPTLVGGIRALILQTAHPAALQGVLDHSRYETDFIGRLIGTSKWLAITSFGSEHHIEEEARRVNAMHVKVEGDYTSSSGEKRAYQAKNPAYLEWVHCAFTESFLITHELLSNKKIDSDQYVREWSKSALPLGLQQAPQSRSELLARINLFLRDELVYSESTAEVLKFIINPPMGFFAKLFYKPLLLAAIASLREEERLLLRLPAQRKIWLSVARFQLALLHGALGDRPPAMEAALARIAREK